MIKACVFLANGFEEVEALTTVDLLRRAEVYVDTVSITDDYMVAGAHGINVKTEELADQIDYNQYDIVILPGGMPGTLHLKENKIVREVVTAFHANNRYVAAICAAPTVLADLGIITGKRATCYPACEPQLISSAVTHEKVTVDGNIITSQGVGTAIDFSLQLIATLCGEDVSKEVAESIVYNV